MPVSENLWFRPIEMPPVPEVRLLLFELLCSCPREKLCLALCFPGKISVLFLPPKLPNHDSLWPESPLILGNGIVKEGFYYPSPAACLSFARLVDWFGLAARAFDSCVRKLFCCFSLLVIGFSFYCFRLSSEFRIYCPLSLLAPEFYIAFRLALFPKLWFSI